MILRVEFLKVSGAGNDFILIDNMSGELEIDWSEFARKTCPRVLGIGADGLLILDKIEGFDFLMRYYNVDGSHGGMCGNGGRCVARYAASKGMSREKVVFRALNSTYYATVQGEWVSLSMPDVIDNKREVDFIDPAGSKLSGQLLDTGAPHVVIPSTQIDSVDVETLGRYICHHPELPTDGTNVNFFCSRGSDRIALRTYERGVEAETLACGTGAVAAAVSAVIRLGLTTPITVDVRSGESLIVDFVMNGDRATHVILTGTARFLFSGFVVYDTVNGIIRDVGDLPPTHRS